MWRYKLTLVGAERIYVCMEPPSTTHAGDCMLIVPEVVEGTLWYVAYEGRATLASFWEVGVLEWQTNAEQGQLHRRGARGTVASI